MLRSNVASIANSRLHGKHADREYGASNDVYRTREAKLRNGGTDNKGDVQLAWGDEVGAIPPINPFASVPIKGEAD